MNAYTDSSRPASAYPRVYRNLMCVGLLGVVYRLVDDARVVNAAVEQTLDDTRTFRMVLAIVLGMAGQTGASRTILTLGPHDEPEDDPSKLALAVSLLLGGDPQWRYWVEKVLACSDDQPARQTAHSVLDFVRGLARQH